MKSHPEGGVEIAKFPDFALDHPKRLTFIPCPLDRYVDHLIGMLRSPMKDLTIGSRMLAGSTCKDVVKRSLRWFKNSDHLKGVGTILNNKRWWTNFKICSYYERAASCGSPGPEESSLWHSLRMWSRTVLRMSVSRLSLDICAKRNASRVRITRYWLLQASSIKKMCFWV